ncbi:MAG: hypothetical protein KC496_15040 [Anaerolineae bacterium]|nr:hypothetical protein [Anaerolineae bacterium]
MENLYQTHNWRIYWYDSEKTILLIEIFNTWTWQDADEGMQTVVNKVQNTTSETFLIVSFVDAGTVIPKNFSITLMGRIMRSALAFAGTLVFATSNALLKSFVDFTGMASRLPRAHMRYHFVDSLEHALDLITTIKKERQQSRDAT